MSQPVSPITRCDGAQAGTSHNLGDNFAVAFGTQFLDEAGALRHPHQSSFGMSTRMIGGVVMTHGDDAGLRLPPRMASVQVPHGSHASPPRVTSAGLLRSPSCPVPVARW